MSAKKKMPIPQVSSSYRNARLIEGETRWSITYYQTNPVTGKLKRERETFGINRIKDIDERRRVGEEHCAVINKKLPHGFPYEEKIKNLPANTPLLAALIIAADLKCANTTRKRTVDMVKSIMRIFSHFVYLNRMEKLPISQFGKKEAMQFLDYGTLIRKVGPVTYNNYIERMRSLFTELVSREFCKSNPFSGITNKKEPAKRRRAFNDTERDLLIRSIAEKGDNMLMLGVLLQYHCFIRPAEMRRMKFSNFDFKDGVIRLQGEQTKNGENGIVTIPNIMMDYLNGWGFERFNRDWIIFGKGVAPHSYKECNHNILNYRQGRHILKLQQKKLFNNNVDGLTFYSWKDTGASELFRQGVNPLEIMRQLRHKSLDTTMRYCQSLYHINYEIQKLDNQIMTPELHHLLRSNSG